MSSTPKARRAHAALLAVLAVIAVPPSLRAQSPSLAQQVEIRRTTYGVPHILAQNLGAAGYGLGYAQLEDYGYRVVHMLVRGRGELARYFGKDSLDSDFAARPTWLYAVEHYPLLDQDTRDVYEGFAAGMNRYIETHRDEFPGWVKPNFSGPDLLVTDIEPPSPDNARRIVERLKRAGAMADPSPESGVQAYILPRDATDEHGSNAWAFAPSRTRSGKAILLRNPHLGWDAGYYEAHVTVPGVLNYYGDYRVGGPFQTIGGFNEHLGWSTTNNAPDPDEVYAIPLDPARTDHYLFDGASVPIRREAVALEYRDGDRIATETREFMSTPLGPVVHRDGTKVYVYRGAGRDYRLGSQWLRMMRARKLEEWKSAMRMLAKPSSNFTYADRDGNIFYVWSGTVPRLPHAPGYDSLAIDATNSSQIWTRIIPFDSLPQLLNPKGGYLHNENDPFHYTNLNDVLDARRFPPNMSEPSLGLRSQHALQLVSGKEKLSLEDVVRLKHSYRMLLAERVKKDLISAIQATNPTGDVARGVEVLRAWDDRVAPESRGGVLFESWWTKYVAAVNPKGNRREQQAAIFREPWSPQHLRDTPRGLADAAKAVEAFAAAVDETKRRHGALDIAWGDAHRVRRGTVDVPVGGCTGALGCFRVLWFESQPDGKRAATGGDGWVVAVEFTTPPRAYSVLAYGQSVKEDSPHFADQAAMFARGELKRVAFTEADIAKQVIRRYRPE